MIDQDKFNKAKAMLDAPPPQAHAPQIRPISISELSLEAELVGQYAKIKELMDEVLLDDDTPANQKAQVANSVVAALGQLIKLQEDLKKQETLKLMESCLIEVIVTLPQETKDAFFAEYERMAKKAGLM